MKLRLATLTILSATVLIPLTAHAGGHTVEKFMDADANKDTLVSKSEFMAKYEEKFMSMDADSDGHVSADEYEAYMEVKYDQMRKEKFKKMDSDGDGMVSSEEMSEYMKSSKHKH